MKLDYDRRIQLLALLTVGPAAMLCLLLLGLSPWPVWIRIVIFLAMFWTTWEISTVLHRRVSSPLQALANLLAALREGDFSFRARETKTDDVLDSVYRELNTLSELLQQQRLKAMEATALLRTVMAEIDVAIFAFDQGNRLCLVNRSGQSLLGLPQERLMGMSAQELGLQNALEGDDQRLLDLVFAERTGRFEVRRGPFRQGGREHQLLVISDLTRPLREEERKTWQKLVRVLGHEINNSLAPIQSLSESLSKIIEKQDEDWMQDARQGLGIIASRAQGLGRFLEAYTRLAKLPEPRFAPVQIGPLVRKVAQLEQRLPIGVLPGPEITLKADEVQLEQALINLVGNAVDATLETGGAVSVDWIVNKSALEIHVDDEGPGLPTGGNLFVPFFTTKPQGNGIGLVLSRQIAEAHGGTVQLSNRSPKGARAMLLIPLG